MSLVVGPTGQPLPGPSPLAIPANAGPIDAIDLGAAPNILSGGVGSLWLDDLAID